MSSGSINGPSVPENKLQRRHRLPWLLAVVTAIILVVTATAYAKLSGNIRRVEVTQEDLGKVRPAKASSSVLNILVVGSDQRDGDNAEQANFAGQRTDIIMLVHLSFTRGDVSVINFPRDSLVQLPGCRSREGLPGQKRRLGMINSSFSFGGIACTWKTIESLTGIHIDHFIKFDFTGFKGMVDAMGGVNLCIPEPIRDTYVQLYLPAGLQTLRGEQALAYVRARHGLGDGSDIGRIVRQQEFFAAMVKKAMSGQTMFNPVRLYLFLDAATKSITADPDLTPSVLMNVALTVRGLSSDKIHFVTTPWRYSSTYPGRVEWLKGPARKLFRLTAADHPLNRPETKATQPTATSITRTDPHPATAVTVPCSPKLPSKAPGPVAAAELGYPTPQ